MKYRVEYISTFHADISTIAQMLKDYPSKASRIFAKADKCLQLLRDWPEAYPVYPDAPSYRYIVIEDYLIFTRS